MKPGKADIVVGLGDGDEGKGRVTYKKLKSGYYTIVVRFNGGNNAGHSLETKEGVKIVVNASPSGSLIPEIINCIGSGCVVDPVNIWEKELPNVEKHVSMNGRLKISALCTAITPLHIFWDKLNGAMIGTTGKGIGPAYADKVKRAEGSLIKNLRFCDILANPINAEKILRENYREALKILRNCGNVELLKKRCSIMGIDISGNLSRTDLVALLEERTNMDAQIFQFMNSIFKLNSRDFIEKDPLWLTKRVEAGENVLMEGAQSFGLDVTYGTVPFQTSSSTVEGNAFVGGDLSSKYHNEIIGVFKAIASRVGAGPFVGEYGGTDSERYCAETNEDGSPKHSRKYEEGMYDSHGLLKSEDPMLFGIGLRMKTGEYGATTGRPRRVGTMDLKKIAYAARRSGIDSLYVTMIDCLNLYENNKVFKGNLPLIREYNLYDRKIDYVPSTADELYQVKPNYDLMKVPYNLSGTTDPEDIDKNTWALIDVIEKETRSKVKGIGVGPGEDEMIYL